MFVLLALSPLGFGQVIDPIVPTPIPPGPGVRITSPPNHSFFLAPVNLPIFAYVVDGVNTTNVEFYANSTDLGPGHKIGTTPPLGTPVPEFVLPGQPISKLGAVYWLVWSNVPPGGYALTAVAQRHLVYLPDAGSGSISTTSAPVDITVLPKVIPTNGPSVVSIVASDPIAVASSNFWLWTNLPTATPSWSNWPPSTAVAFTNWGPKDGLFTVRRCGGESNAINVNYSISGTASNGVDYVELPGSVSIAAGSDVGLIPIVPIDHGVSFDAAKTVVLTLTPDSSASPLPGYILGCPSRAEVLILYKWPFLPPVALPDGSFQLSGSGPDGAWFTVESSPDLQNWTPICTNQIVDGMISYMDAPVPGNPQLFYRAIPQQ